jgi:hypothetical protein
VQDYTVSINFANNLIEKYPMSAAMANINAVLAAIDVEDELKPSRNGGSKNRWGSTVISQGEHDNEVSYFNTNKLMFNYLTGLTIITPRYRILKISSIFDITIKWRVMQQQIEGTASDKHFCQSMFKFVLTSTIFALLLLSDNF